MHAPLTCSCLQVSARLAAAAAHHAAHVHAQQASVSAEDAHFKSLMQQLLKPMSIAKGNQGKVATAAQDPTSSSAYADKGIAKHGEGQLGMPASPMAGSGSYSSPAGARVSGSGRGGAGLRGSLGATGTGGAGGSSSSSFGWGTPGHASRSTRNVLSVLSFSTLQDAVVDKSAGRSRSSTAPSGSSSSSLPRSWGEYCGTMPGLPMRAMLAAAASGTQGALLDAILPVLPWSALDETPRGDSVKGGQGGGLMSGIGETLMV